MSDAKSETIKKANTKKAAMKNVGQKIAEFGVKNMEDASKARQQKRRRGQAKTERRRQISDRKRRSVKSRLRQWQPPIREEEKFLNPAP